MDKCKNIWQHVELLCVWPELLAPASHFNIYKYSSFVSFSVLSHTCHINWPFSSHLHCSFWHNFPPDSFTWHWNKPENGWWGEVSQHRQRKTSWNRAVGLPLLMRWMASSVLFTQLLDVSGIKLQLWGQLRWLFVTTQQHFLFECSHTRLPSKSGVLWVFRSLSRKV